MKHFVLFFLFAGLINSSYGQKYITRDGYIGFFSHTPVEDIKADNNQVASVLDTSTGDIVFQVLIKSFKFQKALMEEHFNENYLESDKFPKSTFSGKITNIKTVDFSKPGTYGVDIEGELTIHGVSKKIDAKGTIEIGTSGITANSKFSLNPEEYNITIPGIVRDKIAKSLDVTVITKYTPM